MKVDRLLGYLQGRTAGAPENAEQKIKNNSDRIAQARTSRSEAVSLAPDFGRGVANAPQAERAERVAEIKSQVQSGSYKQPDSTALAKVLLRDLF